MHIIAVVSRKGGSGKTTLTGHLGVAASRAGVRRPLLIDTDPQGSLSHWWHAREMQTPLFASATVGQLCAGIERIRDLGVELIIIDTPPALDATIRDVVQIADLVVMPVRPSPHDLRAAGDTVALVREIEKPFVFVLNGATARTRIAGEAVAALAQHGPLAPVILHHRTGFAASMIDGRTVLEIPGEERSATEVDLLWSHLDERLKRLQAAALPEDKNWAA